MTVMTDIVYRLKVTRYVAPLRATTSFTPLPSSEKMSVSSRPLFTEGQSPRPLLADLHRLLNDLVEHRGIFAHRAEPRVGRGLVRRQRFAGLLEPLQGQADNLLLGGVVPGAYLVTDEALKVFGELNFHGVTLLDGPHSAKLRFDINQHTAGGFG